ncbi:AI-2E family transporter [Candidatus Sumerlaeota bacterium]|nr:AI-2E family transporter [Candidatus Sumerlaeota bacterium]
MKEKLGFTRGARILMITASFVIVVAGMKAATSILVPFLLSIFISIICTPPLYWLQKKGVPKIISILVIILGIIAAGSILMIFFGASVNDFTRNLPLYREQLLIKTKGLQPLAERFGLEITNEDIGKIFDPGVAMTLVGKTLTSLSGVLSNAMFILLTVVFMLLEAAGFPGKLRAALKDPETSLKGISQMTEGVNRYLVLKTVFSLMTGIFVGIWVKILGIPYAFVWGLLAFILNYVPNIGSIIAAIPAILLALIERGVGYAFVTIIGYIVINTTISNFIEPRIMGRRLGLSPLVVFLSLVFWGWVLGPVGMLLSVPLTMILRIVLEGSEDTRGIAIMLGSGPSRSPDKPE